MSQPARRILITGANKGIGRATVAAALKAHDDVAVWLGSRDERRGHEARAALVADEPTWADRIDVLPIDVADDSSVAAAATVVGERCRADDMPLFGIVNNAGIGLGSHDMEPILAVNTYGPRRVCDAFLPLLDPAGRVVNVSSASGPTFVSRCSEERQRTLTSPAVTWEDIESVMRECLAIAAKGGDFASAGFGEGNPYGLSKACLTAYTIALARAHPALTINACTPGFIETDMTRPAAAERGKRPRDLGMKSPSEGTRVILHLLFGDVGGSGWFFGSDAKRSPLDRYRSPGSPAYRGD